ncbi:class I SAM-dependent methyltransferase [Streptomyces ovatisporus]|uniref:Class I SAM-dependent methyltransferase n=1 Tax=Streptomyces ovatisporus TaxID=1128682 RepID=A0ABV9A5J3_9ACTN
MAEDVADVGYGAQFEGWYDRLFPKDESAADSAAQLAALHPDPDAGTCELGVGTGRIAVPVSRHVGKVTGVDSSPEMLAGLEADPDASLVVPVHADIREWVSDEQFGLVYVVCATLSMITSPEDQQKVLQRASDMLTPGGLLVIETHNKPAVLALHEGRRRTSFFVPFPQPDTGLETHSTLLGDDLWHCSHIWYEDGRNRIGSELSRLTAPEEIDAYARRAGLVPEGRFSDWAGAEYSEQAPMVTVTCRKPEA